MTREDVELVVHKEITQILPKAEIRGDVHLKDLGADSVDRVEILLAILQELRVSLPLSRFSDIPDIDRLVDFLAERAR
ncbi:hypothetical protein J5X84_01925 [Streptosporangiaceae bacterium NEAU-GS5]|nr:hypothetical protein [Streptosporangiaceae bacterium NEAU-GS5]